MSPCYKSACFTTSRAYEINNAAADIGVCRSKTAIRALQIAHAWFQFVCLCQISVPRFFL